MQFRKFLIVGGGPLAFAIAQLLSLNNEIEIDVHVVARDRKLVSKVNRRHQHPKLSGIELEERIMVLEMETHLVEEVIEADVIFLCVPTRSLREVATQVKCCGEGKPIVVTVNKGLEDKTHKLAHQIIEEVFEGKVYHLHWGGASFAKGIALQEFTIAYLASADVSLARELADLLSLEQVRIIPTDQVEGLELVGALKQIPAVFAGMTIGLNQGENARAQIVGQSLRETKLFCEKSGVDLASFLGPGIEDLFLSATSEGSNHYKLGLTLGRRFLLAQNPKRRFKVYRTISELLAKWKKRRQTHVIQRSGELYREVLLKAFVTGMHGIVDVAEVVLYPPLLSERIREITEVGQSISPHLEVFECFYSLPSIRMRSVELGIQEDLLNTRELYKYSCGEQSPQEAVRNALTEIAEQKAKYSLMGNCRW